MDTAFVTGMGAFVSAILIFCGSAFLLLMIVMGARLAYFVTASITLAFVLIMGIVWSINPLGPVGQLPDWEPVDLGRQASAVEFGPATAYPDDPWRAPSDDETELTRVAELNSSAQEYVAEAAQQGEAGLPPLVEVTGDDETTVLLEQDGTEYGATTVEVTDADGEPVGDYLVVMEYDPGNPLGEARMITLGTLVLLALHLVGLSMSEKRARQREPVAA